MEQNASLFKLNIFLYSDDVERKFLQSTGKFLPYRRHYNPQERNYMHNKDAE